MGLITKKRHKEYPLKKFGAWLLAAGSGRKTVPVYVSCVRQALAAMGGDYTDKEKLQRYVDSLKESKYANTAAAWRHFTRYLATQGKQGADLCATGAPGTAEPEAVAALQDVYVWAKSEKRASLRDLCGSFFVERHPDAWTLALGSSLDRTRCSPEVTDSLDVLWDRAGRPENPRGHRLWPQTPGANDPCPLDRFKALFRRAAAGQPRTSVRPPVPSQALLLLDLPESLP